MPRSSFPIPHRPRPLLRDAALLLALVVVPGGCGGAGIPAPGEPSAAQAPPGSATSPLDDGEETMAVCVVEGGSLAYLPIRYDPASGDTLTLDGRRWTETHPLTAEYAEGAEWFARSDTLELAGRRYVKGGQPRAVAIQELERAGEHRGVPVFAAVGTRGMPLPLYLPLRPGCVFQPYRLVPP